MMISRNYLSMKTPGIFFRDEWLDSCEFHEPDGSYFSVSEVGEASLPVSEYTAGTDVEVSVTPVKLQQDSGDASVSVVDITSGPVVDFLDPPAPCCRGPRGATNPRERGLKECACGALIVRELLFECPMCSGRKCVGWSVRGRYFGTREGLERVNWRCVMTVSG